MKKKTGEKFIGAVLFLALLAGLWPSGARAAGEEQAAYQEQLAALGFPASYHQGLWELHLLYPRWTFEAQPASTDWPAALRAQAALGVSLVPGDSPSSWKSTAEGAYNWAESTWVTLDTGGWVAASEAITAYYMDPRNFLEKDAVFQFLDQRYDGAVQTREGLAAMVAGTYLADTSLDLDGDGGNGVTTYLDALCEAGERYGVSPYVLASILLQEQGRSGQSQSISGANGRFPGVYNYFNIGAYAATGFTAVERGLWYAAGGNNGATSYGRPWNSRYSAILGGTAFYAANYLSRGQTTLYLKRYNVQGAEPGKNQYMTNVAGALSEGRNLASAYSEELRAAALHFVIPVYDGMPENPCPQPSGGGSVNAKLASLSVEGYVLTPEFDRDVTEYTVVLPYEAEHVSVTALPCDATSVVSGSGATTLAVGSNTFVITVTASGGAVMNYTLLLSRQESGATASEAAPETPEEPETQGAAAPGRGDVNGDGAVQIDDLIVLRNHLLGSVPLEGQALQAADADGDGNVEITDLIRLRNHILGTVPLTP